MCTLRAFAIRLLLDFDACFEAVRVWHNKRIRGGVSQPAAHAQPSAQALFEQIVEEMARDARTHLGHASATAHTLHVLWAKVAMYRERTQVIFVFVLPLDQTVWVCVD